MSKSVGNVVTPNGLLVQHGSDAVRYWAASARPGTDTAFDTGQMKIGRRLAIKLLNASKFVLALGGNEETHTGTPAETITEPIDRSMLAQLAETVASVTEAFDALDHARALERTEAFFWRFCDDYLELVKSRAYGDEDDSDGAGAVSGAASARAALRVALSTLQRLLAPVLPFATEEAWSWWQRGSIHVAPWPDAEGLRALAGPDAEPRVLDLASGMIAAVRKAKSEAQVSMRTEAAEARVTAPAALRPFAEQALADVRAAGRIGRIALGDDADSAIGATADLEVTVRL